MLEYWRFAHNRVSAVRRDPLRDDRKRTTPVASPLPGGRRKDMRSPGRFLVFLLGSGAALALAACGSGTTTSSPPAGASPSAGGPGAGQTVDVKLQEWAVVPAAESVAAGNVTFAITNTGPEDVHEFVVLKTDLDAGALPTDDSGAVEEAGEGMEVIDEVEDLPVGESQDLAVALDAGHYVLLCNIYDDTEQEAHYRMGMRINFTVE
jgi:uncharacterized cupredoxin-like copper-binding protein